MLIPVVNALPMFLDYVVATQVCFNLKERRALFSLKFGQIMLIDKILDSFVLQSYNLPAHGSGRRRCHSPLGL